MKEDFVTYEIAKKLESKGMGNNGNYGYNDKGEICVPVYNFDDDQVKVMCPCPQIHEVLKWLRKDKGLYVDISLCKKGYYAIVYETNFPNNKDYANSWNVDVLSDTYEKTALACIEYVLDNLI